MRISADSVATFVGRHARWGTRQERARAASLGKRDRVDGNCAGLSVTNGRYVATRPSLVGRLRKLYGRDASTPEIRSGPPNAARASAANVYARSCTGIAAADIAPLMHSFLHVELRLTSLGRITASQLTAFPPSMPNALNCADWLLLPRCMLD